MRYLLAAVALALSLVPTTRIAQSSSCEDLQKTFRQEMDSANSLKPKAAQKAMDSGSGALSQLGIDLGGSSGTQQAIQKGALAATNPQIQGAILIQLLSADAHLQELIWRGCKASSSGWRVITICRARPPHSNRRPLARSASRAHRPLAFAATAKPARAI